MGTIFNKVLKFENTYKCPKSSYEKYTNLVSVIIPVYKPTNLKDVVLHLTKFSEIKEIILVDDSGDFCYTMYSFLETINYTKHIKVLILKENYGRPYARNVGASKASGIYLSFIDQDMIVSKEYFSKSINFIRANNDKCITLGMRETINSLDVRQIENINEGNSYSDWRCNSLLDPYLSNMTLLNKVNFSKIDSDSYSLYDISNKLHELGVCKESIIGKYDLPSIVEGHSLTISKNVFTELGGFPTWNKGYGGEDISLGFLCIAHSVYIVLLDCVSFQFYHKPLSGNEEKRLEEFKKNMKNYRIWAKSLDCFPVFSYKDLQDKIMKEF